MAVFAPLTRAATNFIYYGARFRFVRLCARTMCHHLWGGGSCGIPQISFSLLRWSRACFASEYYILLEEWTKILSGALIQWNVNGFFPSRTFCKCKIFSLLPKYTNYILTKNYIKPLVFQNFCIGLFWGMVYHINSSNAKLTYFALLICCELRSWQIVAFDIKLLNCVARMSQIRVKPVFQLLQP